MRNCFVVAAKMDDGDAPFKIEVADLFPDSYELVQGHVWVVSAPAGVGALDVAKKLGLISGPGGLEDASGLVVPAVGYWGYGHKDMWNLMEAPFRADDAMARAG